MHYVPTYDPIIETQGLLFCITRIGSYLEDIPGGIAIANDYLQTNPILRTISDNGINYHFVALDPLINIKGDGNPPLIQDAERYQINRDPKKTDIAKIILYAEIIVDVEGTFQLLENTIDQQIDPLEVTELAHKLINDGFKHSHEFLNVMRKMFYQYWLPSPSDSFWSSVRYYSAPRQQWYSIVASNSFSINHPEYSIDTHNKNFIFLKAINSTDKERLQTLSLEYQPLFAREMISTAFVDLSNRRIRSAIVHAIISLESATRTALDYLITRRLKGLEQEKILNAISKEVSLVTLSRVVYSHVKDPESSSDIDWEKIQELYNTRNMIIHRSRKRLPNIEVLKYQFIEIIKYVSTMEDLQIK